MEHPKFAVSLMCMDFSIAGEQVSTLSQHADSLHLDIMDGHFAPNLSLSPEWLKWVLPHSTVRNEAHLMTTDPDYWLEPLAQVGVNVISPHVETLNTHAFRTMNSIRALGCGTGLVVNPLTTFDSILPLIERVDLLTLMTIDVGFAGQPFIDEMLAKIEQAAKYKSDHGLNYEIQIDGSCSEKTFAKLRNAGAETFILGNSGLFSLDRDLDKAWAKMRANYERTTGETRPAED